MYKAIHGSAQKVQKPLSSYSERWLGFKLGMRVIMNASVANKSAETALFRFPNGWIFARNARELTLASRNYDANKMRQLLQLLRHLLILLYALVAIANRIGVKFVSKLIQVIPHNRCLRVIITIHRSRLPRWFWIWVSPDGQLAQTSHSSWWFLNPE